MRRLPVLSRPAKDFLFITDETKQKAGRRHSSRDASSRHDSSCIYLHRHLFLTSSITGQQALCGVCDDLAWNSCAPRTRRLPTSEGIEANGEWCDLGIDGIGDARAAHRQGLCSLVARPGAAWEERLCGRWCASTESLANAQWDIDREAATPQGMA